MWQSRNGTGRSPEHATPGPSHGGVQRRGTREGPAPRLPDPPLQLSPGRPGPTPWPGPSAEGPTSPPSPPPDLDPRQKVQEQGWGGGGSTTSPGLWPQPELFSPTPEEGGGRGCQTALETPGQMTPRAAHGTRAGAMAGGSAGWTKARGDRRGQERRQWHSPQEPAVWAGVTTRGGPAWVMLRTRTLQGPGKEGGHPASRGPAQRGLLVTVRPRLNPASCQG